MIIKIIKTAKLFELFIENVRPMLRLPEFGTIVGGINVKCVKRHAIEINT